jgi:hypothetical protein
VAELVDAHGSGPCGGNPVEVQVLSSALLPEQGFSLEQVLATETRLNAPVSDSPHPSDAGGEHHVYGVMRWFLRERSDTRHALPAAGRDLPLDSRLRARRWFELSLVMELDRLAVEKRGRRLNRHPEVADRRPGNRTTAARVGLEVVFAPAYA